MSLTIPPLATPKALLETDFPALSIQDVSNLSVPPNAIYKTDEITKKLFQTKATACNSKYRNFIFLPSVWMGFFTMLYAGALDPKSKNAFHQFLGATDLTEEQWHTLYAGQLNHLAKIEGCAVNQIHLLSNRKADTIVIPKTKQLLEKYGTQFHEFDTPQGARKWGNEQISELTKGMIPEAFKKVSKDLALLLATAALLEAKWDDSFDKKRTEEKPFYNSDGTCTKIPMMHTIGCYKKALCSNDVAALELPLRGDCAMLFIQPKFIEGETELSNCTLQLQEFMQDSLRDLLDNYDHKFVRSEKPFEIQIPKIKLNEKANILEELKDFPIGEILRNYNGCITYSDGSPISVESVKMSSTTVFEMDEQGVKIADACTDVVCDSACPRDLDPPFKVNCPTAFAIINKRDKIIIAMGQLSNMNQK